MNKTNKSIYLDYIDLIRVFAGLMIVALHVIAYYIPNLNPNSYSWQILNFASMFTRFAVPVFFMVSGAVMLRKERKITVLFSKYISHLVLLFFIWATVYIIAHPLISNNTIALQDIIDQVVNNRISMKTHLWYLPALIGCYITVPFLYQFCNKRDNYKVLKYYLLLFLVFTLLQYGYLHLLKIPALPGLVKSLQLDFLIFPSYFLLGYYLSNKEFNFKYPIRTNLAFFILVWVSGSICNHIYSDRISEPSEFFYSNFSIFVLGEAVSFFLLVKSLYESKAFSSNIKKLIKYLARYSLGVYLIHPIIIDIMNVQLNYQQLQINLVIKIAFQVFICYFASLLLSTVILKVPKLKKIIS